MLSRLAVPHLTEVIWAFSFRLENATSALLSPGPAPSSAPSSALPFPWAVTMGALQQGAELWHGQGRQDPL